MIAGPVDGNRYVHVGTTAEENLVTAVSVLPAATTSPPNNNVEEMLFQIRLPFTAELRTTAAIFKLFETLINTPSVIPATFLPAKVSLLDPAIVKLPSAWRATPSKVVEAEPICRILEKTPARSVLIKKPAFPLLLPIIPTIDEPFLSTEIAVTKREI